VTSAALYHLMWLVNITIDIRNVCVFLAPFFSSLTTIITYLLTKELKVRQPTSTTKRLPKFVLKKQSSFRTLRQGWLLLQ
jgi:Oligosaccharyl transferase STT3 subunit